MKPHRSLVVVLALFVLALALPLAAFAQGDTEKKAPSAADMMSMKPPVPGPEQKMLLGRVGTWKTTSRMYMAPGQPPMVSHGTKVCKSINNGLWVEAVDKTNPGEKMPFEGHGVEGWDSNKKKYTGVWVDSWSTGLSTYEGTASEDGKTLTFTETGPGMTGEMETNAMVVTIQDANHHSFKMWKGTDTSGQAMMEMDYVRAGGSAHATGGNK